LIIIDILRKKFAIFDKQALYYANLRCKDVPMSHPVLIIDDSMDNSMLVTSLSKQLLPEFQELAPVIEANNTVVGLEMFSRIRAELVILKYDMPFLDGHEFLQKIFSKGVFARYILILDSDSQHDADALSQRNDVISVLLKSQFNCQSLRNALKKAKNELKKAKKYHQNIQRYEEMLRNLPEATSQDRQIIFNELISGISPGDERLNIIHNNPNEPVFWLVLAEIVQNVDPDFTFYLHLASIKSLQEQMRSQSCQYNGIDVFIASDRKLCLVIAPNSTAALPFKTGNIETLLFNFSRLIEWLNLPKLAFTFYDQAIGLNDFSHAYKTMNNFSKYHFFHYDKCLLKTSQANTDKIMREDVLIRNLLIQAAVYTGEHDEKSFIPLMKNLSEKLRAAASFNIFRHAWNRLIFICNLEIQKQGLSEDEYSPNFMLNDFRNIDEATDAITACFLKLFSGISHTSYTGNEYIEKALLYLSKHYTENVSLEETAKKVNVSSAYLSRLFSKETGFSFIDHLNRVRVSHAQELLLDRRFHISEAAYMVGFNNPKYFSQVFRKYIGCTPIEYRNQYKGGNAVI
jgi:two-component system response regulator YesN